MKIYINIFLIFFIIIKGVYSQVPTSFKYQIEIKESILEQIQDVNNVYVEVKLIQGNITGDIIFNEIHVVSVSNNRLINLNIGTINPIEFSQINWGIDSYYIDLYVDNINVSTSQILSVPYALHSRTVNNDNVNDLDASNINEIQNLSLSDNDILIENGLGTDISSISDIPVSIIGSGNIETVENYPSFNIATTTVPEDEHYIGELYGGGIIYYLDQTKQHGLILSLHDLNNGERVKWSIDWYVSGMYNYYDGQPNTTNLVNQCGNGLYAAKLCDEYTITTDQVYDDWYLPSLRELNLIQKSLWVIDNTLYNNDDITTYGFPEHSTLNFIEFYYWTSTQLYNGGALFYSIKNGRSGSGSYQNLLCRVRAIRKF